MDHLWSEVQGITHIINSLMLKLLNHIGKYEGHGLYPFFCDLHTNDYLTVAVYMSTHKIVQ